MCVAQVFRRFVIESGLRPGRTRERLPVRRLAAEGPAPQHEVRPPDRVAVQRLRARLRRQRLVLHLVRGARMLADYTLKARAYTRARPA